MADLFPRRVILLSNVFDQQYHEARRDEIVRCLSAPKRRNLFRCLEQASGREVIILSSPPKSMSSPGRWLSRMETRFATHRQLFCENWDIPKLRIPLSWLFYARQALRMVRSGDLIVIDNYEFIYVFAAYFLKLFRKVQFVLDYEDGKHLIDRSWFRVLSGLAELMGKSLIDGAILAHPDLRKRLRGDLPTELVPGFVVNAPSPLEWPPSGDLCFLYSGSLDHPRGVDLLLKALNYLPERGWHLHVSGAGPLSREVKSLVATEQFSQKVSFHESLPDQEYRILVASCQVGLNCQRNSDPISGVTFPSKVFTYLSSGLLVLSSTASALKEICGGACVYYEEESPEALAAAMNSMIRNPTEARARVDVRPISEQFSMPATIKRLKRFLEQVERFKQNCED